ncbi:hypothetical protein BDR26DRAFT_1012490 [Obelidium mucronatum]|nr:hypothetical protein BDR26DRAFT_1012490 [Obelidium mucronatum]
MLEFTAAIENGTELKAKDAESLIRHFDKDQVIELMNQNKTLILFFGRNECPYTRGLSPMWLSVQSLFESRYPSTPIHLAKVLCDQIEDFCKQEMKALSIPGIHWYQNGKLVSDLPVSHQKLWDSVKRISDDSLALNKARDVPTSSKEEKKLKKQKAKETADEADLSIRQLHTTKVISTTAQGRHVLFYGANYCPFTQRFTPQWLEFQELYDSKSDWKSLFTIYKVQCAEDENFCIDQGVDGYPTLFPYSDGLRLDEIDTDYLVESVDALVAKWASLVSVDKEASIEKAFVSDSPVSSASIPPILPVQPPIVLSNPIEDEISQQPVHIVTHNHNNQKLEASIMSVIYLLFSAAVMIGIFFFVCRRRIRITRTWN